MKTLTILIIVTSHQFMDGKPTGLWLEELTTPYYAFQEAGFDVVIASIEGGEVPIDPRSLESEVSSVQKFRRDDLAMSLISETIPISEAANVDADALFLPGGHGTMWDFPNNQELASIIKSFLNKEKPVAAVCHGPAAFVGVKGSDGQPIVNGKKIAAFTNQEEKAVGLTNSVPFLLEDKLKELGANFEKGPNFEPHIAKDGLLITGQNPASSAKVAEKIISVLKSRHDKSKKKKS